MHAVQADQDLVRLATAAVGQRYPPPLGVDAQRIFERIGRMDGATAEFDNFIVQSQPAPVGVGTFEDRDDDRAAVFVRGDAGTERGMVDDASAMQVAEEMFDLVDGDRIANPHIDTAALFKRATSVDADQLATGVEQRSAGVSGIDRRIGLKTVRIFQQGSCRVLVAMHAGNDAVTDRGPKIGRQQKGVADGERPVADTDLVTVAQRRRREMVAAEKFDQSDVAGRIDADDHRVVQPAVGHAAFHGVSGGLGDMKVGERVAVRRDDHPRTAPGAPLAKDGQRGGGGVPHHFHPPCLRFQHGRIDGGHRRQGREDQRPSGKRRFAGTRGHPRLSAGARQCSLRACKSTWARGTTPGTMSSNPGCLARLVHLIKRALHRFR